jgi:hypothetical protein
MQAQDELARSDLKYRRLADQSRELAKYQAALHQKSTAEQHEFPFNPKVDVLEETLEAVAGLCKVARPPNLGYQSHPQLVAKWVIDAIMEFGEVRYAQGHQDAQQAKDRLTRDDLLQFEALYELVGEVLRRQR